MKNSFQIFIIFSVIYVIASFTCYDCQDCRILSRKKTKKCISQVGCRKYRVNFSENLTLVIRSCVGNNTKFENAEKSCEELNNKGATSCFVCQKNMCNKNNICTENNLLYLLTIVIHLL